MGSGLSLFSLPRASALFLIHDLLSLRAQYSHLIIIDNPSGASSASPSARQASNSLRPLASVLDLRAGAACYGIDTTTHHAPPPFFRRFYYRKDQRHFMSSFFLSLVPPLSRLTPSRRFASFVICLCPVIVVIVVVASVLPRQFSLASPSAAQSLGPSIGDQATRLPGLGWRAATCRRDETGQSALAACKYGQPSASGSLAIGASANERASEVSIALAFCFRLRFSQAPPATLLLSLYPSFSLCFSFAKVSMSR